MGYFEQGEARPEETGAIPTVLPDEAEIYHHRGQMGSMSRSSDFFLITEKNLGNIGGSEISTRNMLRFGGGHWRVLSPMALPSDLHYLQTPLSTTRIPFANLTQLPSFGDIAKINAQYGSEQPRCVIFDSPALYGATIFAGLSAEAKRNSVAIWRVEIGPKESLIGIKGIKRKILTHIRRLMANNVRINLAVSAAVADSLMAIGVDPGKIQVIPEQVGGEFTPRERILYDGNWKCQLLDHDELGVLVVSRVSPEKGLMWLPKIYEALRRERKNLNPDALYRKVKIGLVGNQNLVFPNHLGQILDGVKLATANTSEELWSESVKFEYMGPKTPGELQNIYNAFDILVNPSPREGFGRVTVEAMNGGMTVIGRAECKATKSTITKAPYSIGLLAGDEQEVASQIIDFMQNPPFLQYLSANALQWSAGHFSLAEAERQFLAAIYS